MGSVKLFGVILASLLVAACSAISGRNSSPALAAADDENPHAVAAELEAEIVRLKEENLRLGEQLEMLARENKALTVARAGDGADGGNATAMAALRDSETIAVPESKPASALDVDSAPTLESADVPVQSSPRLVQPTFTATDAVFENEASEDVATESALFGVHLASYRKLENAREGWRQLQRENPDELGLLEPRVEQVEIPGKGVFVRLIGGGFSSEEKAGALCAVLNPKGVYCAVTDFGGERLSIADANR